MNNQRILCLSRVSIETIQYALELARNNAERVRADLISDGGVGAGHRIDEYTTRIDQIKRAAGELAA